MENKPFHKYRSVWEHAELMERLRRIRHVALDMDGTIYMGMSLFPYTQAFLHGLKEQGIGYSFLTNNPSKSIADYLHKLDTLGIRASRDEMYTTRWPRSTTSRPITLRPSGCSCSARRR